MHACVNVYVRVHIYTRKPRTHTHTVDDDACALAIEYHLVPDPDAKGLFKGSLRGKMQRSVFRSALGSDDRDR